MRILVLSSLYPPYYIGGYEIRCKEVVEGLKRRGHSIFVLTSQYGLDEKCQNIATLCPNEENHIYRVLNFQWFTPIEPWNRFQKEFHDHAYLRHLVRLSHPDIIYVWHCGGLNKSLLLHAQSYNIPVVYHFEDEWFLNEFEQDFWLNYCKKEHPINILRIALKISRAAGKTPTQLSYSSGTLPDDSSYSAISEKVSSRLFRYPKHLYHTILPYIPKGLLTRMLKRWMIRYLPLDFDAIDLRHTCFVSHFRKQQYLEAKLPVQEAVVIHGGIDTTKFLCFRSQKNSTEPTKILCAALLHEGKGIHTVIDAVHILVKKGYSNLMLTISGSEIGGTKYTEFLHQKVQSSEKLQKAVHFTGKIPYEDMPTHYRAHDVFISPSIISEGFPLTIIEAMASGLVVFSTGTGGGREIIDHHKNGILFPPGDHNTLAHYLSMVIQDSELQRKLSENAVKTAQTQFDIQPMVVTIEEHLKRIIRKNPGSRNSRLF